MYPKRNEFGHCGFATLCGCFGDNVVILDEVEIYNIDEDPLETKPLTKTSEQ